MGLMDVYNENRVQPAGSAAPDFVLPDQDGHDVSLSQLTKEGLVLLYFYSGDGDPGVAGELAELNRYYRKFREYGVVPVAISSDTVERHLQYANEHEIIIPLLADPRHEASKAYGVYNSSGINSRVSFIVSQDQEIVRVYAEQRTRSHVKEIYTNIRETLLD